MILHHVLKVLATITLLSSASAAAQRPAVAITNVTVIDVTDGSLDSGHTVLIDHGRITTIGTAGTVRIPAGSEIVDGSGRFLIPGLWDMHVHTFNNNPPQPPNTWTFPLYLANGITGVRDMWVRPGEQAAQVHAWRQRLEAGTFVGPRFGAIGTLVDGSPPVQPTADTLSTPDAVRAYVARLKASGIDFVKVYSRLSPEVYRTIIAEAREAGMYVAGHGPNAVSTHKVVASGQRSIEHLTGIHETCSTKEDSLRAAQASVYSSPSAIVATFDPVKCARLYTRLAADSIWQVPTVITNRIWAGGATYAALRADEGLLYIPLGEMAEWEWVAGLLGYASPEERAGYAALHASERRIIRDMHAAGVPLLAGTDFGNPYIYPGFSLLDELAEFVEIGLTPLAALQTATRNPARYLGREEELGSVSVGYLADLVLLDANPLDDIENLRRIHAVIAGGRLFRRADLDRMKYEVLASNYRGAMSRPEPLGVKQLPDSVLQGLAGAFAFDGDESKKATVALESGTLVVRFGQWTDRLEPLGGLLFRVPESSVVYSFLVTPNGAIWGFDLNDGDQIMRYLRTNP